MTRIGRSLLALLLILGGSAPLAAASLDVDELGVEGVSHSERATSEDTEVVPDGDSDSDSDNDSDIDECTEPGVIFGFEKRGKTAAKAIIEVNWEKAKSCSYTNKPRIHGEMPVEVRVKNFNFLKYGLEFSLEEEVVEAYVQLAELFGLLTNPMKLLAAFDADVSTDDTCSLRTFLNEDESVEESVVACYHRSGTKPLTSFNSASVEWRKKLSDAFAHAGVQFGAYSDVGLTNDNVDDIKVAAKENKRVLTLLKWLKRRALSLAATNPDMDRFEKVDSGPHRSVVGLLNSFNTRATLVEEGTSHVFKKKAAGTIVTLQLVPSKLEGAEEAAADQLTIEYFVQTRFPVLFHAGATYSDVGEVDFETVRSLGGNDLFAMVRDEDSRADITAFLSYQFLSFGKRRHQKGLLLTLGTPFDDPGKTIHVGVSFQLGRFLVTGGITRAEIKEGADKMMEEGMEGDVGRQLFGTIRSGSDKGAFVGLSFTVF